ncbi:efflux RND transporter periplasmic adaptor subunit [Nodosilinea sp. E11]|uniref:efflux RND transporter periplasmic adaptor subunit n=1 Tax=Nodosilinea sp. E11 TaxID=3037479 RepID=UPI002934C63F|nr:HlyD family efflux transporter periplasmic adaptor subunit [Nodosilinea sp. E11]WOD39124.1 HlyD family efflux transporter periplasmic adaptor subunit [Nodosilinea sp. E11]
MMSANSVSSGGAMVGSEGGRRWRLPRWWLYGLGGLGLVGLVVYSLRPQPVAVDLGEVTQGALQVTIAAEGRTRVRDRFVVAAPVAGELRRIALRQGDRVEEGEIVAQIDSLPIDSQVAATQAQIRALRAEMAGVDTQRPKPAALRAAQAQIQAARATQQQAQAQVAQAESAVAQADRDRDRLAALQAAGAISQQDLEAAQLTVTERRQALETVRQQVSVAQAEIQAAQANLAVLTQEQQDPDYLLDVYQAQIASLEADLTSLSADAGRATIAAPAAGQVLQILEESARHVAAGTPLLELGNANSLELVIDILSADAVRVAPGDPIEVNRWGGDETLTATVRQVEPAAFTETSALGVDEQRVNVIADFSTLPPGLGDGYRVDAEIIVWQAVDAVQVPVSALFRCDTAWCTFVADNGRAQQRQVELGHRSDFAAVVASGLAVGDQVILYPSDQIESGTRIAGR